MKALLLTLDLLQPVLVARPRSGEENSSLSYLYLTGSAVRGALVNLYLQKHPDVDLSNLAEKEARRFFFEGGCCFLNGYPARSGTGERLLPAPLSWRTQKPIPNEIKKMGEKELPDVYDFAVQFRDDLESPKSVAPCFAWVRENQVELLKPAVFSQVHNASLERGVKRAEDSFVFRYETLAPVQRLIAPVVGEAVDLLKDQLGLAAGQILMLGGSRSANYGRVVIHSVEFKEDWLEVPSGPNSEGLLKLTLLSDAIFTAPNGQPSMDLFTVVKAAGITEKTYSAATLVGGFNRKWGIPLPQAFALQSGSVFVFPSQAIDPALLERLVQDGIGERRVEGFGRIAVNLYDQPWYAQIKPGTIGAEEQDFAQGDAGNGGLRGMVELTQPSRQVAVRMAYRRLRAALEEKLEEALAVRQIEGDVMSLSQISRLRQLALMALNQKKIEVIAQGTLEIKTQKGQLERAKVIRRVGVETHETSLHDWLTQEVPSLWETDLLPKLNEYKTAGETVPTEELANLKIEFTTRLVDGLLRKTAKRIQTLAKEGERE